MVWQNIKKWGDDFDEPTRLQAEMLARCPVLSGHVALMPDGHLGMGATVGSVIPTQDAIVPSAVGVDIGCGMIAVQTDIAAHDLPDSVAGLVGEFSRSVPSGVGRGRSKLHSRADRWMRGQGDAIDFDLRERAGLQLGTLGSGNHFLEVCLDEDDDVWVVLHSGSRGIGNKLANGHIKKAKHLAKDLDRAIEDPDLAYFLASDQEYGEYIKDMLWAQRYALENREIMMDEALNQVFRLVGAGEELTRINCHHNFTEREIHDGREVWITRKGAIRAQQGDLGVIPGSMGAASYIVRGLGNPESYNSSSHGAGRRLGRRQAKRELTVDSLKAAMGDRAWNDDQAKALLDEHPAAYKDIDAVMEAQKDLVEVVHTLRQIVNYKGT